MRPALPALFLAAILVAVEVTAAETNAAERGRYLFDAAGCAGCHTDKKNKGARLAGGRALKTSFGTFYSPNITPDKETGIGTWSRQDFRRALREGISPDGAHYFPAFPYGAYTKMTDGDIRDLWAYLITVAPVQNANRPHDINWPFSWRPLITVWKALYFTPAPLPSEKGRGAYLVEALGHCSACHTPRNALGGFKSGMAFAGTKDGPTGGLIPNITPDRKTGIGTWSEGDLDTLLDMGMLPDGDFVGSEMGEVVENTTSRLTKADRKAIIGYLRSLPPVRHQVVKPRKNTAPETDY